MTPNPHAGQLYTEGIGRIRRYTDESDEFRVAATYQLDLRDSVKWLGRHNLTALYTRWESANSRNTSDTRIVPDGDSFDEVQDTFNEGGKYTGGFRYYLNEAGIAAGDTSAAVEWPWDTVFGGPTGQGSTAFGVNSPYGSTYLPTFTRSINTSYMAALQGYFWDDRLVLTGGYRKTYVTTHGYDTAKAPNGGHTTPNADSAWVTFDDLNPSPTNSFDVDGSQTSLGAVFKVNNWLSVFYNHADTWDSPLGIHHLDDSRIPAPVGDGKDFGITLTPLQDKLYLRLNYFENTASLLPASVFQDKVLWRLWFIEQQINDPGGWQQGWGLRVGDQVTEAGTSRDASGNIIPLPALGGATFNTDPFPDYLSVVSDCEAKGVEIELVANWPKNWQFHWSLAKTDVQETNIGKRTLDYVNMRFDHWREWAIWEQGLPNYETVYANNWTFINPAFNFMAPWLAVMQEASGRSISQGRTWRSILTTRYNFTDGALKGAFAGGTVRFRSKSTVGYGTKTIANPSPNWSGATADLLVPNIDEPIYGSDVFEFDAFLGYRMRFSDDRYGLRLQLNVRNLFDNDDVIEQKAISTGQIVNYNYREPRTFIFTSTFEF